MNPQWSRAIMWIAAATYATVAMLYTYSIITTALDEPFSHTLNYLVLVFGFVILAGATYKKAAEVQRDPKKINDPKFLFNPTLQIGWGLVAIHFVGICLLIPNKTLRHLFYLPLGIVAYALLAAGKYLGVYVLMVFYMFSMVIQVPHSTYYWIAFITKLLTTIYMGTFAYMYPTWQLQGTATLL